MTAVLLFVFAAGLGVGWLPAYGAGFRKSERMWDSEWTARLRQLSAQPRVELDAAPAAEATTGPAYDRTLENWPLAWRALWPVLVFVAHFWHTPFGEKIDRAAVWLGRFEPKVVIDRPGPQHARHALPLPQWALPTGEYTAVPRRLTDEQLLHNLEVDVAIDALVYRQEVVSHVAS